jgi:hypothetical protein
MIQAATYAAELTGHRRIPPGYSGKSYPAVD